MGETAHRADYVAPPLTVGSLFSGIGGTDLALERAGLKVVWNCENDVNCRKVLAHHWAGIPRFKDVRTVNAQSLRSSGLVPDALVGGFPCQDVSVAGARAGLAGDRSGLFFEFARLLEEVRPAWALIENVPGLLSSHRGADMGTVLGILADIGYGLAWRVLDAQYFGVPQRRRRVFIVGCLGDRARAAQVLFEPEGVCRDPAQGREKGTLASALTRNGVGGGGGADDNSAQANHLVPALTARCGSTMDDQQSMQLQPVAFHMTQDPITSEDIAPAIGGVKPTTGYATVGVAYRKATTSHGPDNDWERWEEATYTNTLDAGSNVTRNAHAVVTEMAVRRLTPLECLRLQGFPDTWLDSLALSDSVKYRMVGNAVAVPVVEWIGRRLQVAHNDGQDRAGEAGIGCPPGDGSGAMNTRPAPARKRR